ncbi:serpin-ZX-like [Silene latifolia]|uniref:serpin-ZX-like n=1 Tax=Silene latifolia TaxID=37657 RepID=UPI003D77B886
MTTTKFSVQVAKHVIQGNLAKGKNMICSPASIDAVLNMVAVGAVNKTQGQLLTVLGHRDIPELKAVSSNLVNILKAPQTSFVNAMWLNQRYSFKPEFEKVMREVHNAHVRIVDFVNQRDQVVKEANALARQATKGLIKQILRRDNIKDNTALLLANGLYFKGTWLKPFKSRDTKSGSFNLLNGDNVRAPFMRHERKHFDYGTFNECQVIKMRYKSEISLDDNDDDDDVALTKSFSMYVFLPFEKDGLPNVMENIKIDQNMFQDELKLDHANVDLLLIPKFKFDSNVDVKNTMKQLGLTLPFDENCMDFSGITDSIDPIYVSDIFQKCLIKTDELGTEAAAFTMANGFSGGLPPRSEIRFVADHPFMFVIREDVSGAILFVGTVLDPKSQR